LSKNFGQAAALLAGYSHAKGNAIITISADLQDPIFLMERMVDAFLKNIDIEYKLIAAKFFLSALILGLAYIFVFVQSEYHYIIVIYIAMITSTSIVLRLSYWHSILDARGLINKSSRIKFNGVILTAVIFWACIFLKFGLYSVAVSAIGNTAYLYWTLRKISLGGLRSINLTLDHSNTYSRELGVLQSKFKISYISGYLSSSTVVPIVFAMLSPIDAGRLGLTLSAFSAVTVISSIFVVVNNVKMANFISYGNFKELHLLFIKLVKYVFYAAIFLGSIACILLFILRALLPVHANKFVDFELSLILLMSSISSALIYSMAIYLRAHKIELLVGTSVVGAVSVVLLVYLGAIFGLKFVVYGYAFSSIFISLPLTFYIFKIKYDENSSQISFKKQKNANYIHTDL
jgi:glycosyltransferase involved in cell wall biosynthesis